jgi:hypothetical protein
MLMGNTQAYFTLNYCFEEHSGLMVQLLIELTTFRFVTALAPLAATNFKQSQSFDQVRRTRKINCSK